MEGTTSLMPTQTWRTGSVSNHTAIIASQADSLAFAGTDHLQHPTIASRHLLLMRWKKLPFKVSKQVQQYLSLTPAKSLRTSDDSNRVVEHEFVQIQLCATSTTPKAWTSQTNSAPDSENPNVRWPVGRPQGSGRRQHEAAERAALVLTQTQTAQKRPVGRTRKDKTRTACLLNSEHL